MDCKKCNFYSKINDFCGSCIHVKEGKTNFSTYYNKIYPLTCKNIITNMSDKNTVKSVCLGLLGFNSEVKKSEVTKSMATTAIDSAIKWGQSNPNRECIIAILEAGENIVKEDSEIDAETLADLILKQIKEQK